MEKIVKCIVERGGLQESLHLINCVVLDQNKNIIFQSGDIKSAYCLRSTLKPFQCAASIKLGTHIEYRFTKREIAIICASHHGEPRHIQAVRNILKKINISEKRLECGFHFPLNKKNKSSLYSNELKKSNIYNNCSGKHAGILALIKFLNKDIKNYISHKHPIHEYLNNYIQSRTKIKANHFAIDGCSLPTPYFNLKTLASLYLDLINAPKNCEFSTVFNAMTSYPHMVSGKDGFDTFFMRKFPGRAVSKGGAEGMQALAIKTKKYGNISLALKVTDGNHRANYISCIKILKYLKIISLKDAKSMLDFISEDQKNINGITVGKLVCSIN